MVLCKGCDLYSEVLIGPVQNLFHLGCYHLASVDTQTKQTWFFQSLVASRLKIWFTVGLCSRYFVQICVHTVGLKYTTVQLS